MRLSRLGNPETFLRCQRGHLALRGRQRSGGCPENLLSVSILCSHCRPTASVLRACARSLYFQEHRVVDQLYSLGHPILVHFSVLIPDFTLRDCTHERSSCIVRQKVWIELDWRSECLSSSDCCILQQMTIRQFDNCLLHVVVSTPEVE